MYVYESSFYCAMTRFIHALSICRNELVHECVVWVEWRRAQFLLCCVKTYALLRCLWSARFQKIVMSVRDRGLHLISCCTQKKQISVLRNLSSKNELNLYVDATGSIITNIPGQKRPYIYSLVVKPDTELPPVSVADMVSTSHTVPRISFFLSHVKRAVGLTGKDLNIKKNWNRLQLRNYSGMCRNIRPFKSKAVSYKVLSHC